MNNTLYLKEAKEAKEITEVLQNCFTDISPVPKCSFRNTLGGLQRQSKHQGFTLIEILVVIVILGILGAVVAPQILSRPDTARVQAAQTDLRTLSAALDIYRLDNFNYPSSDQGLEALVQAPSGFPEAKGWNPNGYIKKLPKDPWGTPYIYENNDGRVNLISLGADREEGGEGTNTDISLDNL
jgi:general secretion pathway protein G